MLKTVKYQDVAKVSCEIRDALIHYNFTQLNIK